MTKTICDFCGNAATLEICEHTPNSPVSNWHAQALQTGQGLPYRADICRECVKELKAMREEKLKPLGIERAAS